MKTIYQIAAYTDPYHGSRKPGFERYDDNTYRRIIASDLDIRDAYKRLLRMFCEAARCYFENWGIACSYKREQGLEAYPTGQDGTRFFVDDVIRYTIEIQDYE